MFSKRNITDQKATRPTGNDRGALALAATMLLMVFIGALGLGVDVSVWRTERQELQSAADSAAISAMLAKIAGYSDEEIYALAWARAQSAGYTGEEDDFALHLPPVDPDFSAANAVQVVLNQAFSRYFTGPFMEEDPLATASAIAMSTDFDGACVLALDPSGRNSFHVIGNADVRLVGCEASVNSSSDAALRVQGQAYLSASCVSLVGALEDGRGTSLECSAPHEHVAPMDNPFTFLTVPDHAALPCLEGPSGGKGKGAGETQILPGRYCGGLNLSGPTVAAPGTYIIDGGQLNISADASLIGIGVTFVFTNGARASITGNAQVNISAPTSGDFAGVVMFADEEDDGLKHLIMASSASTFEGLLYFAEQELEYSAGGLLTPRCTLIVAQAIEFQDDSALADDCDYLNMQASLSRATVALVK